MAEITSYPNPFPETRIKASARSASLPQLFVYGLSSAQRAVTLGTEVLGTLSGPDRAVIDRALGASWKEVNGSGDSDLAGYIPALFERMLPEDEEGYTFYNSVVNDAFAATAYAIQALTGPTELAPESAYYASENLFNLADLLLHRNRSEYVANIAAEPIIAETLAYIESDLEKMESRIPDPQPASLRTQLMAEGRHLAQLAT